MRICPRCRRDVDGRKKLETEDAHGNVTEEVSVHNACYAEAQAEMLQKLRL